MFVFVFRTLKIGHTAIIPPGRENKEYLVGARREVGLRLAKKRIKIKQQFRKPGSVLICHLSGSVVARGI